MGKITCLEGPNSLSFPRSGARVILCPGLGGRIFAEVQGVCPHRVDQGTVERPKDDFNNYGGGNLWPAPEGGRFGFNYEGDIWRVQEAINLQPFEVESDSEDSAILRKRVSLINRAGTGIDALMRRKFRLTGLPLMLRDIRLSDWVAYETVDSFEVLNGVCTENALIGAWTLEQFDATEDTVSFCKVDNPKDAINFDFYEHPGERIAYFEKGFTYRTDGRKAGQIGIRKSANPSFIGFYDLSRRLLCIRENLNAGDGTHFNIADNDQPDGPYSAEDVYSIYNSDPEMAGFELETVGGAKIEDGCLKGSVLVSRTAIAVCDSADDIQQFIARHLGG